MEAHQIANGFGLMKQGAAAVFVKTIGYSPLKTRLASGIGEHQAYDFYRLACQSLTEQLLAVTVAIKGYWAVAESQSEALTEWRDLSVICQGQGGLGERLSSVYSQLLDQHEFVILIGADAPQLSSSLLMDVAQQLRESDFVLGPAADGGFYLMAGRLPLAREIWTSIPYSDQRTGELLLHKLQSQGRVHLLKSLTDVDALADLPILASELQLLHPRSLSQNRLMDWISQVLTT